ncbi:hypothetical protein KIW84_030207 [Lathyrus oleraceus]|uniref:BTB domain-containing protein n=1 Tax=Pisum sativum TaxID=3888 RepID=A0A9D4XMA4_PEA|nr:hypothetical protein KIW84_030207 [Pisum sativum]
MDYSAVVKVTTLYVNSAILAAKSSFFYKLFSNGTRESQQKHVTLKIAASEEVAFMELLKFMYNKPLKATSVPRLLDVLIATSVLMDDVVRPLAIAAKKYLVARLIHGGACLLSIDSS